RRYFGSKVRWGWGTARSAPHPHPSPRREGGVEQATSRTRVARMPLPIPLRERLRIPVLAAPMFIVSGPDLVIEQCKAGVIGSFPALNARPQEELERWLTRIETELGEHQRAHPGEKVAPFAVNLIVNKANRRLEADTEVVLKHKVPIVISSLSAPAAIVPRVH